MSNGDEPDELVRFRKDWQAELAIRKAQREEHVVGTSANASVAEPDGHQSLPSTSKALPFPTALSAAVEVYRRAVEHEEHSQLDDALRLYRQAFRMDPNVDQAYHHERMTAVENALSTLEVTPAAPAPRGADAKVAKSIRAVSGTLTSILEAFPKNPNFEPDDEKKGVPIRLLPDELLIRVLRELSPMSIERFAVVSRKARIVTLDPVIWRELFEMIYEPPQIPNRVEIPSILERFEWDYRRAFVEHPRVRIDGVYIAVCHYVREGLSDNAWVNISHLITYHRYLRFLANGRVLALLTHDETHPKDVIPRLQPHLRTKGMFIGTWELQGTSVHIRDLLAAAYVPDQSCTHNTVRIGHLSSVAPDLPVQTSLYEPLFPSHNTQGAASRPRYSFQMTLGLHSRPLGRWNKLELKRYESVQRDNGEVCDLSLKHERVFWFSRVRSWTW